MLADGVSSQLTRIMTRETDSGVWDFNSVDKLIRTYPELSFPGLNKKVRKELKNKLGAYISLANKHTGSDKGVLNTLFERKHKTVVTEETLNLLRSTLE